MEKGLPKAEMKSLYDDILSCFYHFLIALSFIPAFIKLLSGQIFFSSKSSGGRGDNNICIPQCQMRKYVKKYLWYYIQFENSSENGSLKHQNFLV